MNLDFDKEIDALLRKARRDGPVLVGDVVSPHLDADEISAFAENAAPERSRAMYSAHLADCDRCRKILSNLLVMNAEAAPAAALPSAITIAESVAQPLYRRLFRLPNLAYAMGSLVLLFGGFLAFTVFQSSRLNEGTVISQAPEPSEIRGGPNFQFESLDTASAANTAANVAPANMSMAAANANTAVASTSSPNPGGPRVTENSFVTDGLSTGQTAVAPPPATVAAPKEKDVRDRDDLAKEKAEDKVASIPLQDSAKNDAVLKQQQYSNMPAQSGPMRNNESQYQRQLENMDRRAAARKAVREEEAASGGRKVVGGRTFERKQGVWYDTTYQGRPTINVRRGSAEFNRLDGGLRSIANSLSGTVVVVWGAKAYRIQ